LKLHTIGDDKIKAEVIKFRYDDARLEQGKALLQDAGKQILQKDKERGEAEDSTQVRDAKLDELDEWTADYKTIARVALEEHPQLLEKLGIKVKS
jgi:hypothetical protein